MNKNLFYNFFGFILSLFVFAFILINLVTFSFAFHNGIIFALTGIALAFYLWFYINHSDVKEFPTDSKTVALILLSAFILRFIWALFITVPPVSDYETYFECAKNLAEHNEVLFTDYIATFPHVLGYPMVLSVIFKIFGSTLFVVKMFNCILGTLTVLLTYLSVKNLAGKKQAAISALLIGIMPNAIAAVSLVSTEIIYSFLVMLIVYIYSLKLKYSFLHFAALGILCALSNVIRPVTIVSLLAIAIHHIFFSSKTKALQNILHCVAMIVAFIIFTNITHIALERFANHNLAKNYVGYNLYVGLNTVKSGVWNEEDINKLSTLRETLSPDEAHKQMQDEAIAKALQNPVATLKLIAYKQVLIWGEDGYSSWWNKICLENAIPDANTKIFIITEIISNSYYMFILFFMLIGLIKMLLRKQYSHNIFFAILILGVIASHSLVEAQSRYRFFAAPAIVSIAAFGIMKDKNELNII